MVNAYQKYLSGFVLLIVAFFLFAVLAIELTALTLILIIYHRRIKGIATYLNQVAQGIAISIDIMGNVLFGYAFNRILIRNTFGVDKYHFGKVETISRVLGVNKERGTLTTTGKLVADFLNWIDEDHVEKAAQNLK